MEPITVRFHWTADDLIMGRKHTTKLTRPWLFPSITIAVIIGWVSAMYAHSQERHVPAGNKLLAIAIVLATILLGLVIAIPLGKTIGALIVRRQFAKRPDANMEIEWTITEQGIRTSSAHTKSEIHWSVFQKVLSTPDGFLFMPNLEIFHFLPTRAFESPKAIENLKQLARRCAAEFTEIP